MLNELYLVLGGGIGTYIRNIQQLGKPGMAGTKIALCFRIRLSVHQHMLLAQTLYHATEGTASLQAKLRAYIKISVGG